MSWGRIHILHNSLKALPISAQISAHNLADRLRSISEHLAAGAEYGAMSAHRLMAIAHKQLDKIDEVDPMSTESAMQSVAALTKLANSSSEIPLNLLGANKDFIKDFNAGAGGDTSGLLKEIAQLLPN